MPYDDFMHIIAWAWSALRVGWTLLGMAIIVLAFALLILTGHNVGVV